MLLYITYLCVINIVFIYFIYVRPAATRCDVQSQNHTTCWHWDWQCNGRQGSQHCGHLGLPIFAITAATNRRWSGSHMTCNVYILKRSCGVAGDLIFWHNKALNIFSVVFSTQFCGYVITYPLYATRSRETCRPQAAMPTAETM